MANESLNSYIIRADAEVLYSLLEPEWANVDSTPIHCLIVPVPGNNPTVRIPAVSGSTAYALGADNVSAPTYSVFGESKKDITAVQLKVAHKMSDDAIRFGNLDNVRNSQEVALGAGIDAQFKALFPSLSLSAGTVSGVMSHDVLLAGAYAVKSSMKGSARGYMHACLDNKQIYQLKSEIAGASVGFGLPGASSILTKGVIDADGFAGEFAGIKVYESDIAASTGALYGAIFFPKHSFIQVRDNAVFATESRVESLTYKDLFIWVNSAEKKAGMAASLISDE